MAKTVDVVRQYFRMIAGQRVRPDKLTQEDKDKQFVSDDAIATRKRSYRRKYAKLRRQPADDTPTRKVNYVLQSFYRAARAAGKTAIVALQIARKQEDSIIAV